MGWWMAWHWDDCKPIWSRVEIPTRMQIFFSLIFVQIHTKIVIQIVYYEIVQGVVFVPIHTFFYTNCIVRIHTTRRERTARREGEARAVRAKPELWGRSPSTPPAPTRPHPAAPTLGYTRLPRRWVHPAAPTFRVHPAAPTLGYTRLPRPVRVRSWGGWVRNGIRITIQKRGLYGFTRMA